MIRAVPAVAAMAPYALADLGDPGKVSLAQNESLRAPGRRVLRAGEAALAENALYPDPDWRALRAAIAATHPIDEGEILCGAGSMELIGCLIRAFAGLGDAVLGTCHGYLFVATVTAQAGATYVTAEESGYTVSVDALLEQVTAATRIVFVCNPGNPTGTAIPNTEILRLRESLSDNVLLVVDQAYGEFDPQDPAPVFALIARGDTVVTRTFSKAYALAGARVGWGAFPPAIGDEVRKLMNPNNIPLVSQALAAAAVADQAGMRANVAETARLRDMFAERLRMAGYPVPEARTNFVLIPFADADAAMRADELLRGRGYALRPVGGYGLDHCLRATIGREADMNRVAELLQELA